MSEPHEDIDRRVLYGDSAERPPGLVHPDGYDAPRRRLEREIAALQARIERTTSDRKRAEYRALLGLALAEAER